MSEPASIVVRLPNWVGDVVMSTPALRALRAGHPAAHIAVQLRRAHAPLLAGSELVDEVLPLDSYHAGPRALWREARALRGRGFQLGVCIPESFSSALFLRLAGVERVVGYGRDGRGVLLHERLQPDPAWGKRRLVARERFALALACAVGGEERGFALELATTADEEAEADRLLAACHVDASRPLVLLAPGASFGPSKLWPTAHFAEAADRLVAEGMQVAIIGAPGELELAREIAGHSREALAVLAGQGDLGTAKALVRRAALLICNDAGLRHVAVAFGVPAVVLMGPTSLAKTDLNLAGIDVLVQDVECRPCYARECPIDHRCMTRIEPARVVRSAKRLLGTAPPLEVLP